MGRGFLLRGFESHRTWGGGRCARALAHPSLPASGPLHALSPDAPQSLTHFRSDHAQIPMAVKSTHPHPTHPPSCRSFMEGSQEVKVTLSTEHPSPTLLLLCGPHDLRSQGQLHTELQHSQQNPTPPAATSAASSRLTRLRRPAHAPNQRGQRCPRVCTEQAPSDMGCRSACPQRVFYRNTPFSLFQGAATPENAGPMTCIWLCDPESFRTWNLPVSGAGGDPRAEPLSKHGSALTRVRGRTAPFCSTCTESGPAAEIPGELCLHAG